MDDREGKIVKDRKRKTGRQKDERKNTPCWFPVDIGRVISLHAHTPMMRGDQSEQGECEDNGDTDGWLLPDMGQHTR